MIDHISLPVADYEASLALYDAVMKTLGYDRVFDLDMPGFATSAYGEPEGAPIFWIGPGEGGRALGGHHIAFAARKRADVDAFHEAGLKAGATDNGLPGLRPQYHEHYYAAFLTDLDGHHIEAVCHAPY